MRYEIFESTPFTNCSDKHIHLHSSLSYNKVYSFYLFIIFFFNFFSLFLLFSFSLSFFALSLYLTFIFLSFSFLIYCFKIFQHENLSDNKCANTMLHIQCAHDEHLLFSLLSDLSYSLI